MHSDAGTHTGVFGFPCRENEKASGSAGCARLTFVQIF